MVGRSPGLGGEAQRRRQPRLPPLPGLPTWWRGRVGDVRGLRRRLTPGEQAAQVGGARLRPGMVPPPGHQVRGFRGSGSAATRAALPARTVRSSSGLPAARKATPTASAASSTSTGTGQVQHRHHRMAQQMQKAHQRGVPHHRRGAPRVSARRREHAGIIGEQFLTEAQLLQDGIVEPVNAATGSRGDGHVGGEAEECGRDSGPQAEGLGDLWMLPERRRTGVAGARLRHPEGPGVGPWEGDTEQPTEAEQAGEPRAQTSRT